MNKGEQIHASCVEIGGCGVLLRGPPGAGKSDLALRLIDAGARLVADDRVDLRRDGARLRAAAPAAIAGLLEVRGLGILRFDPVADAVPGLVVDLVPGAEVMRLPEPESVEILGIGLALFRLAPFEASIVAKVRLAVDLVGGAIMPSP